MHLSGADAVEQASSEGVQDVSKHVQGPVVRVAQ